MMFLLIRGWMDGWPVEDETGWDGVAAAGMPVEWCKPKWNGLGWIAWRSLQGCDWGPLTSSDLSGDAAKRTLDCGPSFCVFVVAGSDLHAAASRQASSKSRGRRETENRVAFRPDLESTRFIQAPVLTITTYPALHFRPAASGFHHWLQSPPCLPFQQRDPSIWPH